MSQSPSNLTMNVRPLNDKTSVIDVHGAMTATSEAVLMDAYSEANRASTRAIVLNFSDLEYLNSSGIGLLVTLLVRANRQKQRLIAWGLSEHYRHIFELTRLDDAIGIVDSEADALALVNQA
jgi:anti-sigma B factor antagonist